MEQVALVTGAARGIGAATVRRLVAGGYGVIALDACSGDAADTEVRYPLATSGDLDDLVAELGEAVIPVIGDVRNRADIDAGVEAAVQRWGRLDVAVAAAAVIDGGKPMWETSDAELETLWDVDVRGVWNTAASTIPVMLSGADPSRCRFVAVGSAASTTGLYRLAAYTTAKHAVVGLVKALAADMAGTGVTAAVVAPGSTRTRMLDATAELYGMADTADLVAHQLIGRVIEPEEIASTIAFCCSAEGGVLNGAVVHADGGFRA